MPEGEFHEIRDGNLKMVQNQNSFKISQESIWLAKTVRDFKAARAIDLGTGCGIIPLLIAKAGNCREIFGIDIQPELIELARANLINNQAEDKIQLAVMDIREVAKHFSPGSFDLVISNPPFIKVGAGTVAAHHSRRQAMQEFALELPELAAAASYLLRTRGIAAIVFTVHRLVELLTVLRRAGLEPKRLFFIHHHPAIRASAVIVHAQARAKPGLEVCAPIILNPDLDPDPTRNDG